MRKLKIVTVIGARPQFIKAAPVSALIREKYRGRIREILVHTAQHYARNMSKIFLPSPHSQVEIPSQSWGRDPRGHDRPYDEKIEKVLLKKKRA